MKECVIKTKANPKTWTEIAVLRQLVAKRRDTLAKRKAWLDNDSNRMRSTYETVASDTKQLEERLREMIIELTNKRQEQK